jgi:hypothetical protein
MFSLLFLHFFLYGCNVFAWRKARINYSFIFELCPTKELKYRDVFLICTASMSAVMGVMFVHLALVTKGYSNAQVRAIPGLLLLVISWSQCKEEKTFICSIFFGTDNRPLISTFPACQMFLLLLVCPFNIIYRSTRYCFLRVIRNIISSPLYKVLHTPTFHHHYVTKIVLRGLFIMEMESNAVMIIPMKILFWKSYSNSFILWSVGCHAGLLHGWSTL